jgi:hypothetical protein
MVYDQARTSLSRQVSPCPLDEDAQSEIGCREELDVNSGPYFLRLFQFRNGLVIQGISAYAMPVIFPWATSTGFFSEPSSLAV